MPTQSLVEFNLNSTPRAPHCPPEALLRRGTEIDRDAMSVKVPAYVPFAMKAAEFSSRNEPNYTTFKPQLLSASFCHDVLFLALGVLFALFVHFDTSETLARRVSTGRAKNLPLVQANVTMICFLSVAESVVTSIYQFSQSALTQTCPAANSITSLEKQESR